MNTRKPNGRNSNVRPDHRDYQDSRSCRIVCSQRPCLQGEQEQEQEEEEGQEQEEEVSQSMRGGR